VKTFQRRSIQIKCFDEAGFKLADVAKANYGHSLVGASCIEVTRNINTPNMTLQVLAGLEGILYANTLTEQQIQ